MLMKRFSILSFALFYLLVSSGLALNIHYCGGEMVDLKIFTEVEHECCSEGNTCHQETTRSCCDDETILVQLDSWQVAASNISYDVVVAGVIPNSLDFKEEVAIDRNHDAAFLDLPPPKPKDLWLLYQRLTYYG